MKILYVSDLDGTLLGSNERTSEYTNDTINELVESGMLFSYATARSYQTAQKVTKGLRAGFPLIVYNGTMVVDNKDGAFLIKNFFGTEIKGVLDDLLQNGIYPIVYSFIEGEEKFSYIYEKSTTEVQQFLDTRKKDKRDHPVRLERELYEGELFYVTCIGTRQMLQPFYEKYRETCRCLFQEDIYTKHQWLEMMPKAASKASAIRQLKARLGCEKTVVFGDGKNDVDMFEMAEEAYAVSNAVEELKQMATAVIGSNDDDGVAKWLREFAVCADSDSR